STAARAVASATTAVANAAATAAARAAAPETLKGLKELEDEAEASAENAGRQKLRMPLLAPNAKPLAMPNIIMTPEVLEVLEVQEGVQGRAELVRVQALVIPVEGKPAASVGEEMVVKFLVWIEGVDEEIQSGGVGRESLSELEHVVDAVETVRSADVMLQVFSLAGVVASEVDGRRGRHEDGRRRRRRGGRRKETHGGGGSVGSRDVIC
ncbi:uncharacterized protein J3D65DRAFT_693738, partial [Phyllosticta citribraziliensis]